MNYQSFLRVFDQPSVKYRKYAEFVGGVAEIAMNCGFRDELTMRYFSTIISPAFHQRRIKIFYDKDGEAIAYLIWATLVSEVEDRVLATGRFDLHISEWNEGDRFWIVDFVGLPRSMCRIWRELHEFVNSHSSSLRYLKNRHGRYLCKEFGAFSHLKSGRKCARRLQVFRLRNAK